MYLQRTRGPNFVSAPSQKIRYFSPFAIPNTPAISMPFAAYDNVCDVAGVDPTRTEKQYEAILLNDRMNTNGIPDLVNVTVEQEEPVYYCPQGFRQQTRFAFPPRVDDQPDGLKWMTDSQVGAGIQFRLLAFLFRAMTFFSLAKESVVMIYYVSVIVAVVLFLLGAFLTTIINTMKTWFHNAYQVSDTQVR